MKQLLLITGNRRAGLTQLSQSLAWHFSPKEEGIVRMEWMFDNCENWENDPRLWAPITAETKVLIVENIPDYFEYNRLIGKDLLNLHKVILFDGFVLPAGKPIPDMKFIFTSHFHPKMEVEGIVRKHYKLT